MAASDFSIYVGDSRSLIITVQDQNGVAVNITGATFKWVIVNQAGSTIRLKDNGTIGGISITNAINGQCTISIAAADTQSLPPGSYSHEARMIDSASNSSVIFKGTITVNQANI